MQDLNSSFITAAKKRYGTTSNWRVGCFIFPDGEILNCGDPEKGFGSDVRTETHKRAVEAVYRDLNFTVEDQDKMGLGQYSPISAFERLTGAVRLIAWEEHDRGCAEVGFEWSAENPLTSQQLQAMRYVAGNCRELSWGILRVNKRQGRLEFCDSGLNQSKDPNQRWRALLNSMRRCEA